jgi:hypothetical protein
MEGKRVRAERSEGTKQEGRFERAGNGRKKSGQEGQESYGE